MTKTLVLRVTVISVMSVGLTHVKGAVTLAIIQQRVAWSVMFHAVDEIWHNGFFAQIAGEAARVCPVVLAKGARLG